MIKDKLFSVIVAIHPSPYYCKCRLKNCMYLREYCGYENKCMLFNEGLELNKTLHKPLKHEKCPGRKQNGR